MSHGTVLLILEGARHDYIHSQHTPFLHGLAQRGTTAHLTPTPGFHQHAAILTGRTPDGTGFFTDYVYDPTHSPFRWIRNLGPAPRLLGAGASRHAIEGITTSLNDQDHADAARIPPRYLPNFRPAKPARPLHHAGNLGGHSLFDVLQTHGRTFHHIEEPIAGNDHLTHDVVIRQIRDGPPTDFILGRMSTLDRLGHDLGPNSPELRQRAAAELDERIASIHAALTARHDTWDLLLVGDHGMAPIQQRLDLRRHLRTLPSAPGKDYIPFLHTTFAQFWALTSKGEAALEQHLPNLPGTSFLSPDDRKQNAIPTDRAHGDFLLAANPGVAFAPDYFHHPRKPLAATHGYLDPSREEPAVAIVASSTDRVEARHAGTRPITDVLPTVLQLLELPPPRTARGTSLLSPTASPTTPELLSHA